MNALKKWIEGATSSIQTCKELSEGKIWSCHGVSIWKADRFIGSPHFYPVYRHENFYSYSLPSLILHKGSLNLNRRFAKRICTEGLNYASGKETLDRDIVRLGGPLSPSLLIKKPDAFARRIADAMRQDISAIEDAHHGFTNIILCGGKDSLNMLLLPWENPVLVASAPPNYDHVKTFVARNGLGFETIPLRDNLNSLLDLEILTNCCRNNLEHCRWTPHLKVLSDNLNQKVIFWKGQLGDTFMTPYWKTYTHPPDFIKNTLSRIFSVLRCRGQYRLQSLLSESSLNRGYFFKSLWYRGAMWQGSHMSIIRQLVDALVLSAYHGPQMRKVLSEVDLRKSAQYDVRPLVGEYLHGGPVNYPEVNPGPPTSNLRKGLSHLDPFLKALSPTGIPIQES